MDRIESVVLLSFCYYHRCPSYYFDCCWLVLPEKWLQYHFDSDIHEYFLLRSHLKKGMSKRNTERERERGEREREGGKMVHWPVTFTFSFSLSHFLFVSASLERIFFYWFHFLYWPGIDEWFFIMTGEVLRSSSWFRYIVVVLVVVSKPFLWLESLKSDTGKKLYLILLSTSFPTTFDHFPSFFFFFSFNDHQFLAWIHVTVVYLLFFLDDRRRISSVRRIRWWFVVIVVVGSFISPSSFSTRISNLYPFSM